MKRFLQSEIGAVVAWVLCSLVMGAVIAPWMYRGGMWLAAAAGTGHLPAALEWLGDACGRSRFSRFFVRSLSLCAVVFLPLLLRRIRLLRTTPDAARVVSLVRYSRKFAALQIVTGCVIAGGLLWAMGVMLESSGVYLPKAHPPGLGKLLSKTLIPAAGASLMEEWLFRGVLLGLWLRFSRPATACIGTSLLFAFLHFLEPPAGTVIADPGHFLAGFELLGKILLHFTDPLFFVADFASLLVVGLILAWARVRTGALWFSIGLHAGWILAFKSFNLLCSNVAIHVLRPWGVGESLRSGVIPLVTLGITAVICHFVLKRFTTVRTPA